MMRARHRTLAAASLFLLLAVLFAVPHGHADGSSHGDCAVCMASRTGATALRSSSPLLLPNRTASRQAALPEAAAPAGLCLAPTPPIRAPPL